MSIDIYQESFTYYKCATCGGHSYADAPLSTPVCTNWDCADKGEELNSISRETFLSEQGLVE